MNESTKMTMANSVLRSVLFDFPGGFNSLTLEYCFSTKNEERSYAFSSVVHPVQSKFSFCLHEKVAS